jgi:predicted ester cyclase
MSTEENKAAARGFIDAFNRKDLDGLGSSVNPDVVNHALMPGLPPGLEGWKMMASMFFAAFPDMQVAIDDLLAEGDKVVTRWTARGKHEGAMMGIPPTGNDVTLTGITIDRYVDGKTVEHWENLDMLGMMQQLGVIPPPAQGAS